ncbi:MAG: GNAT family N-acetyltransferase [Candidatus Hodarchaeales archaeon]
MSRKTLESIIKLYREYVKYRDSPLPLYSDKHNENWILNPEYADFVNLYYFAEDLVSHSVIGMVNISLNTGKINPHMSYFSIYVLPEYRRKGIANNILKTAIKDLPEQVKNIMIFIRQKNDDLNNFLISRGAKHSFTERRSVSDIKNFNLENVSKIADELREKALKKGYEIIIVKFEEFEENKYFNFLDYIHMIEEIDNDMPREDGSFEDIELTPEIYNSIRNHFLNLGQTAWTYVAVHKKSRKPVGMTETWFSTENPTLLIQADTGVIESHRGNGLGLALKYQMLKKLLTSESTKNYQYWVTSNANSNQHMININNQLRYKEIIKYFAYEFDKKSFEEFLH